MSNDLAAPEDLAGFPGAPFTENQVDAAVAAVRSAARWHIAPEREETVTLDVAAYDSWLRLPTRKLVSVDEVRDVDADEVIEDTGYRVSLNLAQVKRSGYYWPCGYGAVEVDMTHGYESCPADVLPVIALAVALGKRDPTVSEVRLDDYSVRRNTEMLRAALAAELGEYALDEALLSIGIA